MQFSAYMLDVITDSIYPARISVEDGFFKEIVPIVINDDSELDISGIILPGFIDSHIHIFPDPLAPKVIPKLAAVSGYDNQTDGTLSSTLEKMREWGVDKGVFLNIATKPSQQKSINDFCASIASDTVIPFGSVHPDAPDWEAELERIAALGLKGIKLHPDYQGFDMDEPRVLPIFQKARDLDLCVVVHAGFDPLSPEHIHCRPSACRQVLDACGMEVPEHPQPCQF